ncbi:MAG TPA: ATP synthase F0 subunit B [Bacteriovoracaceae bacterium]|nr:ATP synthase F0 subunit B [Bacteriovoracaceae bacterium]
MRIKTLALLSLGLVGNVFAAGDGHGSPADLIAPAVNVALLGGFLIYKLKGPLSQYFINLSKNVTDSIERASIKSQEAQMMLENEKRKQANLENELANIKNNALADAQAYEKKVEIETENKIQKLKSDATLKINAEKKARIDSLNNELLEQVIKEAKTTIKTNKDYQNKASSKLIQGL